MSPEEIEHMAEKCAASVFGENIRKARRRASLTQRDLAARCGIGQSRISQIENGHRLGALDTAHRIARALGVSLDALLLPKEGYQRQTQTRLAPGGNCWQTATACVLGVDAARLPDQSALGAWYAEQKKRWREWPDPLGWCSYGNLLNVYLWKHHHAVYHTILAKHSGGIRAIAFGGLHLLEGATVRTPDSGLDHVIVGRNGQPVWDPHPSRDGLTVVKRWGLISPLPVGWEPDIKLYFVVPCPCPRCGGTEVLEGVLAGGVENESEDE